MSSASSSVSTLVVEPYAPPFSDVLNNPLKMLAREMEIRAHEIEALSAPPHLPLVGAGPPAYVAIDAEWQTDPATKTLIVVSVQIHVIGECGEFAHIHRPGGRTKADRPSFDRLIADVLLMAMEEGVILEWPEYVIVAAFFLRADLCAFSDLARFKQKLDAVGGSVGTRGPGIPFDVRFEEQDIERLTRARRIVADDGARSRLLQVRFLDLVRHTPIGTRLDDIGLMLGHEKIKLPPGAIERMLDFSIEDPELFEAYAAQDALIAAYFLCRLRESIARLLGKDSLPLTASGVAVSLFKRTLRQHRLDFNTVFGRCVVRRTVWDERNDAQRTVTDTEPLIMRALHADLVTRTAHGGRGECGHVGPTLIGALHDIDISSAYTTVLAMFGLIAWEYPEICLDIERYCGHVVGFALVEFRHSEHIRYPVFPVEGEGQNLFFPRGGRSFCTAAEIEAARHIDPDMEIRVVHGVIYPWKDANVHPFEPFVTTIRDERGKYPKKTFDNEYIKLVGNSLFGRTGMGLKPKTTFDAGEMKSVKLEPDEMTNEVIFSFTMGYTRALIAELMNSVPRHHTIVSVTTDGFLTSASLAEIDQSGPIATRFKEAAARVAPGEPILEVKHRTRQIISARVRAQFTGVIDPDPELADEKRIVLAKGNVTPDITLPDGPVTKPMIKALQNAYLIDLYLGRTPESKTMMRPFISLRQQWIDDLDVFRVERPVRLNLEFDWKRKAVSPRMVTVGEGAAAKGEHIALDTVPWETVEEAEATREIFKGWRKKRCMKTMEDWRDWEGFLEFNTRRRSRKDEGGAGINRTQEGDVGVMRRMFLRAYAQEKWRLVRTMSYPALAAKLTEGGYPTTEIELKNAKRAKLAEGVVPPTEDVLKLIVFLQEMFPNLDVEKFVGEVPESASSV